ncbi:hypothetical protein [Streptomyces sp. WAC 01325]|nr:hypothetical protein [Streptomyces sp. WAC 01325]
MNAADESTAGDLASKAAQAIAILRHQTREQAEPQLLSWGCR